MDANASAPDIVVVGASAGGIEALQSLVARLPRGFGGALLVVSHVGTRRSALPGILQRAGPLRAVWAVDGEPIRPGRIHVAPPDHHLLVAPGCGRLLLSRGPAENRTRPAVDPLFRSAARACGPRVVGVVLSGMLGDGTAGLSEIARRGGTTVVQDPDEAQFPGMPLSALRHVPVHHRLPVEGIAGLLVRLCGTAGRPAAAARPEGAGGKAMARKEDETAMEGERRLKRPVALTCPGCGGAVEQSSVDSLPYFECHTGHRFAAPDMDEAQFQQLEDALEVALRMLNERVELCRRLGEAAHGRGQKHAAAHWAGAARQAEERAETLRRFVEQKWARPSDDGEQGGFADPPLAAG